MTNALRLLGLLLLPWIGLSTTARTGDLPSDETEAGRLLAEVRAHRPAQDLELRARLTVDRQTTVPCTILIQNRPQEVRTVYRLPEREALVIQPLDGEPRYFLKGRGELQGEERYLRLADSQFRLYDLGLPFLTWADPQRGEPERYRGRTCEIIEVTGDDRQQPRARLTIDTEFRGLLRAELFNEHGDLVRTFMVTSFKRVGDVWIPRRMEMVYRPRGQSLPAAETSRLEIYDGNYDAALPPSWFDPAAF